MAPSLKSWHKLLYLSEISQYQPIIIRIEELCVLSMNCVVL